MQSKLWKSFGAVLAVTLFPWALVESASNTGGPTPRAEDAKAVAMDYAARLKAVLQAEMGRGGPVAAVGVCSEEAMKIGSEVSRASGWSVRRVTSRTRNPLDLPDSYESGVLGELERALASGKPDAARFEVVTEGGVRYARFMKAIKIENVCLACHGGKEVGPETAKALRARYPHDTARNYKLGDLRGAVSLKKKLD